MSQNAAAKKGGKTVLYEASAAVGTAVSADLASIALAWPTLPAAVKAGIVAIVNAATPGEHS